MIKFPSLKSQSHNIKFVELQMSLE